MDTTRQRRGAVLLVACALAVTACPERPPTAPVPGAVYVGVWDGAAAGRKLPGATVKLDAIPAPLTMAANENGNAWFESQIPGGRHLWVTAPGYRPHEQHLEIPEGQGLHLEVTLEPERRARRGLVRLDGYTWRDDEGPRLALGVSLFWGVWGYQHDRARLERTLTWLADHGVDYARVLGVVGPSGAWEDRMADPRAAGYDAAIAGVTDLAWQSGLKVEWTIFGGVDTTPTPASRTGVVDRFIAMSRGREPQIALWEVANEADNTGWRGREMEASALAQRLRARTPHLVAVTAERDPCGVVYYAGSTATIRTAHLDRSQKGEGGLWRPVRQPWEMQFCAEPPQAWTSNEPIGPGATVAADDDPLRITMSAATTWLSHGAAYLFHARPGIRGGGKGDMDRGGPADWWEVKRVEETFAGLNAMRALLPPDLPNWQTHNTNDHFPHRPFDVANDDTHLRTYCATKGMSVVCLPLQITPSYRLVARRAITGTVHHPLTGGTLQTFNLAAGGALTLDGKPEAVVIRGTWK